MSRGRLLPRIWRQTRLTSCITAPKTSSAPAFRQHSACKLHNADESRPTKIPYHASGTSPVRPDQYGLPSFLSLCCRLAPITRASAAPVGASRVPQNQISSPERSGCPQQPPGFVPDFQTAPFWGRTLPTTNLLLRAHTVLVLVAGAGQPIYGAHQVPRHKLDTWLGMHSATWMNTWRRHHFAPIAPSRKPVGNTPHADILDIINTAVSSDSTGRNTNLGVRPLSLSTWAWDQSFGCSCAHDRV